MQDNAMLQKAISLPFYLKYFIKAWLQTAHENNS